MSLAIVGSRNFSNYEDLERAVLKVLEKWGLSLSDLEKIVSGGALGVDKLAEKFAKKYSIETVIFPADWKKGRAAGPIRNSFDCGKLYSYDCLSFSYRKRNTRFHSKSRKERYSFESFVGRLIIN